MWMEAEWLPPVESVDSNTPGTYVLSYNYTDSNGNAASTVITNRHGGGYNRPCAYH